MSQTRLLVLPDKQKGLVGIDIQINIVYRMFSG
jgi:hypothetical protein